jgi:hypothetical protein
MQDWRHRIADGCASTLQTNVNVKFNGATTTTEQQQNIEADKPPLKHTPLMTEGKELFRAHARPSALI